jgi:hypothetical protein
MNRLWGFTLTILSALCVYVSVSCYYKITEYDAKLVSLNILLNQQSEISNSLNAEDLIIMKTIDEQNKRIKEQDEQIRIQNVLINEARAKIKRK